MTSQGKVFAAAATALIVILAGGRVVGADASASPSDAQRGSATTVNAKSPQAEASPRVAASGKALGTDVRVTPRAANAESGRAEQMREKPGAHRHSMTSADALTALYILVLAGFVGFEVIGRVSPLLHTPLMSATNAISGISLVGSLVAAGNPELGTLSNVLGFIAVTAATINVVGGFLITDRMLRMFKLRGQAGHE